VLALGQWDAKSSRPPRPTTRLSLRPRAQNCPDQPRLMRMKGKSIFESGAVWGALTRFCIWCLGGAPRVGRRPADPEELVHLPVVVLLGVTGACSSSYWRPLREYSLAV
jgi:hypothetical protein